MNRWRLWSGVASCVLGIAGYIFLVALCVSGIIPIDLNMDYSDMYAMMEQMDDTTILMLGRSAQLVELLVIAGIVSIIGHNKRWYWNIPVALMMAQATAGGFMGYKYLYPIAVWAAVCLFMSIVALRTGYRALHSPEAEPTEKQDASTISWEKPQAAPDQWEKPAASQTVQAEPQPSPAVQAEPQAPQTAPASEEPVVNTPLRAMPVDDYGDGE